MNVEKLLRNIIDQMKEAQIKLGYDKETIRLYYPVDSLNTLLQINCSDEKEMLAILNKYFMTHDSELGHLACAIRGGRIEICIPPEGSSYVHEHVAAPAFLTDIIDLFRSNHHCELIEIRKVFEKYSSAYVCEKTPAGMEFDYVMYFEDTTIDPYYYCIKMEMGHTIYHRFTREDYHALIEG